MTPEKKTAAILGGVVAVMVGLSFAAVPFYNWFCRVTGYAGTVGVASVAPDADAVLDREVTIHFDGSTDKAMPWKFKPLQREMKLRIGDTGLAFYEAYNPTDRVIAGTASYNVTPDAAGGYFTKIECFCFTEQVLQPGERVEMPVTFFVDPSIVTDDEGKFINEITLSYTFFEQPLPEDKATLATSPAQPVN